MPDSISSDPIPPDPIRPDPVPEDLARLAEAWGVATSYENQARRTVTVSAETVVAVLAALGVDASTPAAIRAAIEERRLAPLRRLLPPVVVLRRSIGGHVDVHPPDGVEPEVTLTLAGGGRPAGLQWLARRVAPVDVDGVATGTRTLVLPADLPLGRHELAVRAGDRVASAPLLVVPDRQQLPPGLRAWGWMVQLYAARSRGSWGIGDLADLATLARWSGEELGAGLLLVNPLHATAPMLPQQPSPYYPASRRFINPVYLRVEATAEYAAASPEVRAAVDALGAPLRGEVAEDRIDRDAAWRAKRSSLELLWRETPRRRDALDAFARQEGDALVDFATWCALAERYGGDWRQWPEPLRRPHSPAVAQERAALTEQVEFFCWLQLLCDEQLAAAQDAASAAGMPLGIMHDLAVGTDPAGADAWALQDVLALGARVGAPPDEFNQLGQDWGMPPWHPQRVAEQGYEPLAAMWRAMLRHGGGLRIDHVLGLFRMWWVPEGQPASRGTYVRYDADALLGVLLLEAHRAGAVVVGEDLGTVEPRVREVLADRGVLGSSVLWFERAEDPRTRADLGPQPLARWRPEALASVTTHDLPTAAGWLRGEQVKVRHGLGQLDRPLAEEEARAAAERNDVLGLLDREGLLDGVAADDDEAMVAALHEALVRTPSRLVAAALWDAVGDVRQPNLPGTVDEYPNWRLPVAAPPEGGGPPRPLLLEEIMASPRVRRLAARLAAGMAREASK